MVLKAISPELAQLRSRLLGRPDPKVPAPAQLQAIIGSTGSAVPTSAQVLSKLYALGFFRPGVIKKSDAAKMHTPDVRSGTFFAISQSFGASGRVVDYPKVLTKAKKSKKGKQEK